ncbi:MAG: Fe(2+) transporter permease subunit FeoB [Fibrobacteraceae bacterium]
MTIEKENFTIALAGNPNCGKTALFNALTGSRQEVGNWPGVTVDKKEGFFQLDDHTIRVMDLPGIYALFANSDDERATLNYLLTRDADLVINIIDSTNLERNLFLTTQLMEMDIPMVIALNMMDIAVHRGIHIDEHLLSERLGIPVLSVSAVSPKSCETFLLDLHEHLHLKHARPTPIRHADAIEKILEEITPKLSKTAGAMHAPERWVAIQYLEGSAPVKEKAKAADETLDDAAIAKALGEDSEFAVADSRYAFIRKVSQAILKDSVAKRRTGTDRIDKFVLNRFLGVPLFILAMYLVFWVTITFGSAFIDFFDILFGAIFVDGFAALLQSLHAPGPLIALLAGGVGTGIQTVATFIPPIFFMFFTLAFLEDSGYMARAAFIMDKFMTFLGLPGKAFVPMLVGFGCSVPALLATRTLDNKRDRFLAMFMIPFMSCGARLPVYALFGVAFFGKNAGNIIFAIYIIGILIGMLYGLFLKKTIFKGKATPFIMELPPYHAPHVQSLLLHAWMRLKEFLFRAGKIVIIMVTFLGFLNSVAPDGSFGNTDNGKSILAHAGRVISPVFEPLGVEKENWPASVALLTGIFAKEAIVGTLTSLYEIGDSGNSQATPTEEPFSLGAPILQAFQSVPTNLVAVFKGFLDPFHHRSPSTPSTSSEVQSKNNGQNDAGVLSVMRTKFHHGPYQVFAFLLFVLLYVPCVAALGTAFREVGTFYGILLTMFQTLLGWSLATLFFQITVAHNAVWISASLGILGAIILSFILIGMHRRRL